MIQNIKKFSIFFCLLLITRIAFSQQSTQGEEPYPAPRSYADISSSEATFIALFEDKNISNLHLYSNRRAIDQSYPYQGVAIESSYRSVMPKELKPLVGANATQPEALFSMRAADGEMYVIRHSNKWSDTNLSLFTLQNDVLKKVDDLAFVRCKESGCVQRDTWIKDVDGDTRLDLIQKTKYYKKNNGKNRIKTVVYAIQNNGKLKKIKPININNAHYQMKKLNLN